MPPRPPSNELLHGERGPNLDLDRRRCARAHAGAAARRGASVVRAACAPYRERYARGRVLCMPNLGMCLNNCLNNSDSWLSRRVGGWAGDASRREQPQNWHGPPRARAPPPPMGNATATSPIHRYFVEMTGTSAGPDPVPLRQSSSATASSTRGVPCAAWPRDSTPYSMLEFKNNIIYNHGRASPAIDTAIVLYHRLYVLGSPRPRWRPNLRHVFTGPKNLRGCDH